MKRFLKWIQIGNVIMMWISIFMFSFGVAIMSFFIPTSVVEIIQIVFVVLGILFLCLYLLILFMGGKYLEEGFGPKRLEADKYSIKFKDYDKLHEFLIKKCDEYGYKLCESSNLEGNKSIEFYKRNKMDHFECISIFRVSELDKETIDLISKLHDKFTDEYLNNSFKNFYGCFITILIVDRKTEAFDYLINSEYTDEYKIVHVPVGISLGGKNMYISKMKGMTYRFYKKAKKEFLEMMEIEEQKR